MVIGICDDNEVIRNELCRLCKQYIESSLINFKIVSFSSGEAVLAYPDSIDIIFMDIQMRGINGLATAKKIRERDENMIIIFLTGYKAYMQEGYQVRAFRYLVKPMKSEDFFRTLNEAVSELTRNTRAILTRDGKTLFVRLHEIMYIECEGRNSLIRTKNYYFESTMTMQQWQNLLNTDSFYRVHKTYIVNMEYVKEIGKNIILDNGEKVELAVRQAAKFKRACKEYRKRNAR